MGGQLTFELVLFLQSSMSDLEYIPRLYASLTTKERQELRPTAETITQVLYNLHSPCNIYIIKTKRDLTLTYYPHYHVSLITKVIYLFIYLLTHIFQE